MKWEEKGGGGLVNFEENEKGYNFQVTNSCALKFHYYPFLACDK